MSKIILNGRKMTDRETLHNYLAETLSFPEYYGRNLDALNDMLTSMRDVEIELRNVKAMLKSLRDYGATLLEVFYHAADEDTSFRFTVK